MREEAYVIDSFAWFEYFTGSNSGGEAREFIEGGHGVTPTIVIAELSEKYRREERNFSGYLRFIAARTRVVPLDAEIAQRAGVLSFERKRKVKRWGLADSIVLSTAMQYKARVVTGDEHFRDLHEETVMIRRGPRNDPH